MESKSAGGGSVGLLRAGREAASGRLRRLAVGVEPDVNGDEIAKGGLGDLRPFESQGLLGQRPQSAKSLLRRRARLSLRRVAGGDQLRADADVRRNVEVRPN